MRIWKTWVGYAINPYEFYFKIYRDIIETLEGNLSQFYKHVLGDWAHLRCLLFGVPFLSKCKDFGLYRCCNFNECFFLDTSKWGRLLGPRFGVFVIIYKRPLGQPFHLQNDTPNGFKQQVHTGIILDPRSSSQQGPRMQPWFKDVFGDLSFLRCLIFWASFLAKCTDVWLYRCSNFDGWFSGRLQMGTLIGTSFRGFSHHL